MLLALLLGFGACAPTAPSQVASPGYVQLDGVTYRVRHSGSPGESTDAVIAQMLSQAARLARDRGYGRFAVLDQAIETAARSSGVRPTFGAQIPIVRSKSRSSRRRSGSFAYVDLGRATVYVAVATIQLFDGEPPAEALATYDAQAM